MLDHFIANHCQSVKVLKYNSFVSFPGKPFQIGFFKHATHFVIKNTFPIVYNILSIHFINEKR